MCGVLACVLGMLETVEAMKLTQKMMDDIWWAWMRNRGSRGLYPKGYKMSREKMTRARLAETIRFVLANIEHQWITDEDRES